MSYNDKKFLDQDGLVTLLKKLDNYPTNEILGTVVSAIQTSLGGKVGDVQANGTSIVDGGIANIPYASTANNKWGLMKIGGGLYGDSSGVMIDRALPEGIKSGTGYYCPIVPKYQEYSVFYGLSKAAGIDLASTTVTFGTYTDAAKQAIQNMFGITNLLSTEESSTATAAHALNSTFMMDGKLYKATTAIGIGEAVAEGTNCEVVKADEIFIKNTDYADSGKPGIVQLYSVYGITKSGGFPTTLQIAPATSTDIKKGNVQYKPIVSNTQHEAVFYGLSKAAGADLKDETVTFGTYPETSKTAIRSLIGAAATSDIPSVPVQDIQVNGASIVSNGVANIPIAGESLGLVKINPNYGIGIYNGYLLVNGASTADIKAATNSTKAISTYHQHESVFYGLAKAAGANMSSSNNAVGTYTQEAKTAIQSMLGIEAGATCIETVSGTTPTITAQPNVRYNCGEVSTISITPPASGTCDVFFTSGSTAAVLTVPSTVKFPVWFDATALETETIYEIMITDGVYGSVMTWES